MWTSSLRHPVTVLFCLLWLTVHAAAQDPGLVTKKIGQETDVRCLYPAGTHADYGVLFPLVLEYHNMSPVPQPFELEWSLEYEVPAEYRIVVLEPGAKKRIPLLFPPGAINQLYSLEVNGQNIPAGVSSSQDRPAGLLTGDSNNLDYLRSMQLVKNPYYNPANTADGSEYNTLQSLSSLDEEVFPEHWAALKPLQVLVCYDLTALNLGDLEYQAIVNWVRQGGDLVIVSNGLPTEYRGTPLEEILPMAPDSVATEDDMVRVKGPLQPDTKILVGAKGEELLLEKSLLKGHVYYLTTPLLDTETLGKDETLKLWRFVFDKQLSYPTGPHSFDLMRSMPELPRTQAGWVALFVILYGIIVGPVNLSILRKKDKMLWSFVTVPVVAIFFAGTAYVLNRVVRPSSPVLRELGYLSIQANEKVGLAESEQLLFSPYAKRFTIESDATSFFQKSGYHYSPFGAKFQGFGLYRQTAQGGLESHLEMGTWDIRRFQAESNMGFESAFVIDSITDEGLDIEAPVGSDDQAATVYLPGAGSCEPFTLKPGRHTYQLNFTGQSPTAVTNWNEDKYPGRDDLTARVYSAQSAAKTGMLYFWTGKLATPLQVDQGTIRRHDYLVCVEFEP